MRPFLIILSAVLCLVGSVRPARAQPNAIAASAAADQFLAGMSSCDIAQRQRLLRGIVWQTSAIDHSAFSNTAILGDGLLETDSEGVVGYERLVKVSIRLSRDAQFFKTFRLVAYADRRSQRWKIWSFEEGTDAEARVLFWRDEARRASSVLEAASATLRYADSLGASGRLIEALDMYLYLLQLDAEGWDEDGTARLRLRATVRNLRRIMDR